MEKSSTQYDGVMTSDVRVHLTDLVRIVALTNLGKRPDLKKILGIAIELLDNAQRYCSGGNVFFNWELANDQLVISIKNKASKTDALRLLTSVEAVNNMNQEQLTEAFRAQLTNGEYGVKGGAGLGLLDMARKAYGLIRVDVRMASDQNYVCQSLVSIKLN